MAYFEFPHTRTYDTDLGWLIKRLIEMDRRLSEFINLNTIKYADPIAWNITSQYEGNTVVINPADGTAYISTGPVPSGVLITNTDYWTPIFNYGESLKNLMLQISSHFEGDSPTASAAYTAGDLLWWNNELYRVIADMAAGTAFIPDVNIEQTTIENEIGEQIEKKLLYLTPEQFGAIGDGSTDDYAALQAAIDAAVERDLPLILTRVYRTTQTLRTGGRISIASAGDLPYYPGIISDADTIISVDTSGCTIEDIYLSTEDRLNTHGVGIDAQAQVDDLMLKLVNVHFRYLQRGLRTWGNSVECYDCHFSVNEIGIEIKNGSSIFSPWEFKSFLVKNCRFHDTIHCVKTDATLGAPESYNNGIDISENFADKCGAFYEGIAYNVIIRDNHYVCARRDENSEVFESGIYLNGADTGTATTINTTIVEGNIFATSQAITNFIRAVGIARYLYVRNNTFAGGGTNLIKVENCPYTEITGNTSPNKHIIIDNATYSTVKIEDNSCMASATITANGEVTIRNNPGYTYQGTMSAKGNLLILYQGTMTLNTPYDIPVTFTSPITDRIIARVRYNSIYYYIPLDVKEQLTDTAACVGFPIIAGVSVNLKATFSGNTVSVDGTVDREGSTSIAADVRGVYVIL